MHTLGKIIREFFSLSYRRSSHNFSRETQVKEVVRVFFFIFIFTFMLPLTETLTLSVARVGILALIVSFKKNKNLLFIFAIV